MNSPSTLILAKKGNSMRSQARFAIAVGLTTVLLAASAELEAASAYKATIIHPMGYDDSVVKAI